MTEKNVIMASVINAYNTIAPFYGLFTSPYDDQMEANFILTYALRAGAALDVGAGQGDIALALAARGIAVYCVEPAAAMRQAILTRLASQPSLMPYLTVLSDSATDVVCQRRFPLIYMFYMFQHILDSGERQTILSNLAQHLAPGGTVLLNLWMYENLRSELYDQLSRVGLQIRREYAGYDWAPFCNQPGLWIIEAVSNQGNEYG